MPLKYTTEKINFFYLHSYMKIFQAKRKNSNPKPFPEGRVARVARRDERFTLPFVFMCHVIGLCTEVEDVKTLLA